MIDDLKSLMTGRAASIKGSRPLAEDVPLKVDDHKISEREQRLIQICLNCDKPKCTGNCAKMKRRKNEHQN